MKKMTATCLFFKRDQGFGFLAPDDQTQNDIYFHFSGLVGVRRLAKGDRVEYELGERNGKPMAVNIRLVAEPTSQNGGAQ